MKGIFAVLSVPSLLFFALADSCQNAFETYFHGMFLGNTGNFSSSKYLVDARLCKAALIAAAVTCAAIAIVGFFKSKKE